MGELPARQGWWGQVRADELPLLLRQASRPVFLAMHHRAPVIALADSPQPMSVDDDDP
jgi:hypothetical protein